jgi:hypothetical protein
MSSPFRVFLLLLGLAVLEAPAQTTVQGEPFGYVKMSIAPGTGTGKKTTLISIPLLEEASITGKSTGAITGLTATTITSSGAGWSPGELSVAATPHLLEITSGNAQGRMFLLSTLAAGANTSDTVTIDPVEVTRFGDLRGVEIEVGDSFRIRPVDTLQSFFGTPQSTRIQGGTAAANADTITIVEDGASGTYFYKTDANPPRWTRVVFGNPNASNTRIPPHAGVQYARLPATPLEFIVTGKVPDGKRKVAVKNSGTTILAPYWPVSQTLADLAIQNIQNWGKGASASLADTLVLTSGGASSTFFHDGTNWRRVVFGSPIANTTAVPVGASILLNKKVSSGGFVDYQQTAPYNLQ